MTRVISGAWLSLVACGYSQLPALPQDASVDDATVAGDVGVSVPDATLPTTIRVTVSNRPDVPAPFHFLAAYQDGDGGWQPAPAPDGDTYTFVVTSGTYGFAWTCIRPGAAGNSVDVWQFTAAEKPSLSFAVDSRCTDRHPPATVTLSGAITKTPPTSSGSFTISAGTASATYLVGNETTVPYSLDVVPGTYDIIASHTSDTGSFTNADLALATRGVAVPGPTVHNVDFASAAAVQSFAVTGLPTNQITAQATLLVTANGTAAVINQNVAGATQNIEALASTLAVTSDVYEELFAVIGASGASHLDRENFVQSPTSYTWNAPALIGAPEPSIATTTPYPEVRVAWPAYADATGYDVDVFQTQGTVNVAWTMRIGPRLAGTAPHVQMPDLSGLPGWSIALQFESGVAVQGTLTAFLSSAGADDFPAVLYAPAGVSRGTADTSFAVTP